MFYGVACQRPSTGELAHGVLSTTQMVTPAITRIIPRNVPALILPSPRAIPASVVMSIVKELVMGTAIDKSTDASVK